MTQMTTEQALQIPQQLRKQAPSGQDLGSHSGSASGQSAEHDKRFLSDDAVTLMRQQSSETLKNVKVENYKTEVGQDLAYVKETLRNKLAEYRQNPATRLSLEKDVFGNIQLKGPVLQTELEKIARDLNNSQAFKEAFNRINQQQPTLNYVDNVVKLAKAYGVSNPVFNSLLSERAEYNGLQDIAHRYQALKSNNAIDDASDSLSESEFKLVLN